MFFTPDLLLYKAYKNCEHPVHGAKILILVNFMHVNYCKLFMYRILDCCLCSDCKDNVYFKA